MATAPRDGPAVDVELVQIADAPITKVTVFKSARAEVTRAVHLVPKAAGILEVKLQGLPHTVDRDSVRLEGTGLCSIVHVSYEEEFLEEGEKSSASELETKQRDLQTKVQALEDKLAINTAHQARTHAVEGYVRSYAMAIVQGVSTASGSATEKPRGADLDTFDAVLAYTKKHMEGADEEKMEIELKRRALQAELDALREQVSKLHYSAFGASNSTLVRQVVVSLDVAEPSPIDLLVRYVTSGASWTSSYDVRVDTARNAISCTYYGEVRQATGEDWNAVLLTLSTAEPTLSGTPPAIASKTVGWLQPRRSYFSQPSVCSGGSPQLVMFGAPASQQAEESAAAPFRSEMAFGASAKTSAPPPPPPMPSATAAVDPGGSGAIGAVAYPIAAPATVKSNNTSKKLTIGILALSAEVTHYVVPSLEASAYLKAKVLNTTDYLLLASSDVSIFFDNRFVTKTSLRTVSPGEGFDLFLGVDPGVKVAYAPPRKTSRKRGMFSKTHFVTHTHGTTLTNTKAVPITVALVDVLPRSSEDTIKVVLKDPSPNAVETLPVGSSEEALVTAALELAEGGDGAATGALRIAQSEAGKMVWIVRVPPHGDARVPFEYTMEWPSTKEIQID